ncbi:LytTR family transcriptional regulator [Flavobacteriaceae bacterium TP-CH-4]|uniref:LytTR family transcriptional regulator n=1 Tax=Pelagihabitans pacificus TaxID=2696054 RepID=A0A967ASU4_9FLAO|nr:LytTR family transcriptional regulator [Pelagihabitans pacificus]NHF58318.1 LytTR family transcriptional regulator [Pelagihabitans pacificus]
MRKDRLYLLTFLGITIIFLIISSVAVRYFVKFSVDRVLETQLEFSKREAREVASLLGEQLKNGVLKDTAIISLQNSIGSTNQTIGFVSMFDWSGKIICHPDIKVVGQSISPEESFVSSVSDDLTSKDFYSLLQNKQAVGGIRDFEDTSQESEVIYLYPVDNSDWIIAAHANTQLVMSQINDLRNKFYNILIVMGLVMIVTSVVIVRLIGSRYENRLEEKNVKLSNEVVNLAKLNSAVDAYQKRVVGQSVENNEDDSSSKSRILTYHRNELRPVPTKEIAYIYTENTITYIVCIDSKRSTSNSSLDELISNLDGNHFFRANRQFIIAISAIEKIVKYGNNQLKILINPNSELDIIISKNRASEFKQWLNQ